MSSRSTTTATRAPASPSGPDPLTAVADLLREGTRAEHDRIEDALDWTNWAGDRATYAAWLARLHAFYAVWEPALAAAIADPAFVDPRRKLPLLERDLAALGSAPGPLGAAPTYPFTTRAEALGAFYVLEGSTLGGQLIAAHVRDRLGFEPAFHGSYGKATAAHWRDVRDYLDAAISSADRTQAIAAANRTFATLREHLGMDSSQL
ncbi:MULTISPECIES: biliverdin-producing heme oxygenase [Sphingomonas]|uniref:biliverdin-producing heme oxygenase n=1 Tax=Sphingomonas TaxID=13687 RepID=UPI000DEF6505|nr:MULTISPECIES: biliverdin-producing heme oxygenase [Sphingomonas]